MSLPSPAEIAAALIAREELPAEKGDIGPQGMDGKAGEFGPPGPQGAKGDPGRNGTNGTNGNVGPKGPQGNGGPRGPKGEKGDKGDEGERGPIGPMGPTGAVGSGKALFPRPGGGSGGGAPSGAAGGDLSGTYPNPSVANDSHSHTGATLPAAVQTKEFLNGSAVLMPGDEALRYLPWTHVVGDTLLDLTDPLHPTIIDAGVYAFTVNIVGPNGVAAIYDITAWCFIGLDVADGDAYQDNQFPIASLVGAVAPIYSQALTHYCAAGSEVVTHVRHAYGASLNFAITQANVQRLS